MKKLAQSAFDDVANSYQDILIRGHLMPNRDINHWIAEMEYSQEHAPEPEQRDLNFLDNRASPEVEPER